MRITFLDASTIDLRGDMDYSAFDQFERFETYIFRIVQTVCCSTEDCVGSNVRNSLRLITRPGNPSLCFFLCWPVSPDPIVSLIIGTPPFSEKRSNKFKMVRPSLNIHDIWRLLSIGSTMRKFSFVQRVLLASDTFLKRCYQRDNGSLPFQISRRLWYWIYAGWFFFNQSKNFFVNSIDQLGCEWIKSLGHTLRGWNRAQWLNGIFIERSPETVAFFWNDLFCHSRYFF